jgi:hypothetical protein
MKVKVGFDDRTDGTVEVRDDKFAIEGERPDSVRHFVEFYADQLGREAADDNALSGIKPDAVLARMVEQMQGRSWAVFANE